jgi:hypothetical protein
MKPGVLNKESSKENKIFFKTSNSNLNSNMSKNNSFLENSPGMKFKIDNDTGGFTSLDKDNKNSEINLTTSQLTEGSMDSHESSSTTKTNKMIVNYTKSEVKEKISKIFMSFAKFYKEDKQFLLSQQALVKILKKLNLVDEETLRLSDLDLIFRKINPHSNKLNEKQFLDYIVKLVGKMYPQEYKENAKNSVNFFISNTFEPYSKYLEESQGGQLEDSNRSSMTVNTFPLKSIENLVTKTFDSQVNALLHSVYFAIKEIYLNYFHYEVNNYKDKKKIQDGSFTNLLDFCKDFEVFPYLINMDQLVVYYNLIIKTEIKPRDSFLTFEKDAKDIGVLFTLSRFCLMFYHFAIISYLKNNTLGFGNIKSATDVDKLLLFLEKLENSRGFKNLERRTSRPHVSKLTLIPNKNVLSMIDLNIFKIDTRETNFENKTVTSFPKSDKNQIDTKTIKEFNLKSKIYGEGDLRSLLSVDTEVFTYIQNKLEHLKELFQYYSLIGDKLSFNRMNISSFRKFLKDCDILITKPRSSSIISGGKTKTNIRNLSAHKRADITKIKNSSLSKSPMKSENKSKSPPGKNNKNTTLNNTNRFVNFSEKGGKLTESDANIIFFTLTGPRNFDNSAKIKQQFDKNTGFIGCFDENISKGQSVYFDKTTNLKNNKDSAILKMDFFIFLKSLELIATRLYPKFVFNRAVIELFEKVKIFYFNHYFNI